MQNRLILKDRTTPLEIQSAVAWTAATEAELKAIGDNIPEGYVAGWASTSARDHYDHVVEMGAFSESIAKRGLSGPTGVKFLHGHDRDKIIGVIKVLEYRGDRLWIEAQMNLDISYSKDLYAALKMTGGLNFSVGFWLEDYSWEVIDEGKDDYLRIKKGDLFEVSIVPFPGNDECIMEYVKGREREERPATIAQFEKALVSQGLCQTRSAAAKITRFVKSNSFLFGKTEPVAPKTDETQTKGSLLEPEAYDAIEKKLADIKALLQG